MLISLSTLGAESDLEKLQSAFVFKFIHYVEWPASTSDSFVIVVCDNPKLYEAMKADMEEKVVSGKTIKVMKLQDKTQILEGSKIIIAHDSEKLDNYSLQGMLVITADSELKGKSVINFFEQNGKLRFDINQTQAMKNNLKINSRLLKLARMLK